MAAVSGRARTAKAVKAAAEKRTREGTVLVDCSVCGKTTRKWKSNIAKAKWPLTCSRKCRGKLMTGPGNPHYQGTWIEKRSGYRWIRPDLLDPETRALIPPGKREVSEHRAVMARMIGRWPTSREHVHHINGDKLDNRPENLTLMDWAAHSREHRTVLRRMAVLEAENRALRDELAKLRQTDATPSEGRPT